MGPNQLIILAVNITVNICFTSRIKIPMVPGNQENMKFSISGNQEEEEESKMKIRNISLGKLTLSYAI